MPIMNTSTSIVTIFAMATFILVVNSKAIRNGSQSHAHIIEYIIDRILLKHLLLFWHRNLPRTIIGGRCIGKKAIFMPLIAATGLPTLCT